MKKIPIVGMNPHPIDFSQPAKQFDGVMIGAGVRVPPSNFILFEILAVTWGI